MSKELSFDISKEFDGLDFNSTRLEHRFVRTMATLFKHPGKSIWFCSENRAESKAIYRMLSNDNLDFSEILRAHRESTIRRISQHGGTILAIQDTTSLNYSRRQMSGIGYISDKSLGVNIHSCLAVSIDGLVLGLLDQSSFNREQAKDASRSHESKKSRPMEEKESYRWVKSFNSSTFALSQNVKLITVCDREGDIYELMDAIDSQLGLFLIRVAQNRTTTDSCRILDAIKTMDCAARVVATIPRDSRQNRKSREAILQIRYKHFDVKRPIRNNAPKDSISTWIIHAKEESPPDGVEAIEWFLMSNDPVETAGEAYEKVKYYMQRWKIERFHYVLKSGCAVEKLQERSVDKITLLVLMYSVISVFILNLTHLARISPEEPCSVFFEDDEWKLLYCVANKTQNAPTEPYNMQDAIKYLSWLGGPKRAPSDGPPGVKTIWMALEKFYTLVFYKEWMG